MELLIIDVKDTEHVFAKGSQFEHTSHIICELAATICNWFCVNGLLKYCILSFVKI